MMEFKVRLKSVQQVQEFVDLATSRPFRVLVKDEHHQVNGKSFMEMFCLNFTMPLTVSADCSQEQWQQLMADASHFLAR